MLVHSLLIESVDLRRLGGSTGGNDVLGDSFDRCQVAPGEKKLGPLRRKGVCDSAADRASGSVDHRNLVLQQHLWFLPVPWVVAPAHLMSQDRRLNSSAHGCHFRHPSTSGSSEPSMMQTPRRRESGRPPTAQFAPPPVSIQDGSATRC